MCSQVTSYLVDCSCLHTEYQWSYGANNGHVDDIASSLKVQTIIFVPTLMSSRPVYYYLIPPSSAMAIFYSLGQEEPKQYFVMPNWPVPQDKLIDVWFKKFGRDLTDISHTNLICFMTMTNFKLHISATEEVIANVHHITYYLISPNYLCSQLRKLPLCPLGI